MGPVAEAGGRRAEVRREAKPSLVFTGFASYLIMQQSRRAADRLEPTALP